MAYWRNVFANELMHEHVRGVDRRVISETELDAQLAKFNFARAQLVKNAGPDQMLDHLATIPLRNTDALVRRINSPGGAQTIIELVERMWSFILDPIKEDRIKPFTRMYDPENENDGLSGPMLSPVKRGFVNYGIGFRGDARAFEQLPPQGFLARFAVPPGQPGHVAETWGTLASSGMAIDKAHCDFANQTGVCVARNPIGSMKFIGARNDSDVVISASGFLYAVKIAQGFDTEGYQIEEALRRRSEKLIWRAGEKAARYIPKYQIVASCKFLVDSPYSTFSGVTDFSFLRLTDWTFHNLDCCRPGSKEYIQQSTVNMPLNTWQKYTSEVHDWAKNKDPLADQPRSAVKRGRELA